MKQLSLVMIFATALLISCSSKDPKVTPKDKEKYEKGKVSIEEVEKKDPVNFLSVSGRDRKNLIGQTVIKGTVTNNAKMITYKDIDVKLSFYSKTGVLLEEDHETIYEKLAPGNSADFKSKYLAPKKTDSIAMKVVDARVE